MLSKVKAVKGWSERKSHRNTGIRPAITRQWRPCCAAPPTVALCPPAVWELYSVAGYPKKALIT